MLSRIQSFIEAGDQRLNDIQVRCNKLPVIFNRYDTPQSELKLSDNTDNNGDRGLFENQYYQLEVNFSEILPPVMDQPSIHSSPRRATCQFRAITFRDHIQVEHTSNQQPLLCQISTLTNVAGYFSETHLSH